VGNAFPIRLLSKDIPKNTSTIAPLVKQVGTLKHILLTQLIKRITNSSLFKKNFNWPQLAGHNLLATTCCLFFELYILLLSYRNLRSFLG
jgi:hypothetical protein